MRFSLVNPFEFYDLGNEVRLRNLSVALKDLGADDEASGDRYKRIKMGKQNVAELKGQYSE